MLQRIEQETGGLNADVGKLRVEKWKIDSATKHQASENIGSIQRNITGALPGLIAAVRVAPQSLAANFKLYRNLNALYDVVASISESAGAFGETACRRTHRGTCAAARSRQYRGSTNRRPELMLRAFNACLVVAVLCAAYVLYSLEHSIRGVERQITRTNAAIINEKETIGLLNAEWSSLTRPERLQRLAEQHLDLRRISPDQFVKIDELEGRVPAEPPVKLEEQGKDAIGDILKAME